MPEYLSNTKKLLLYKEALDQGIINDYTDVLGYISNIEDYLENNPPPESISPASESGYQVDPKFLKRIRGMNEQQYIKYIEDLGVNKPYTFENIGDFTKAINKTGFFKHQLVSSLKDGKLRHGFITNVDHYEVSRDGYGNPVYLKFYSDGTYDVLKEDQFNKEKDFNNLPNSLKKSYYKDINEVYTPQEGKYLYDYNAINMNVL